MATKNITETIPERPDPMKTHALLNIDGDKRQQPITNKYIEINWKVKAKRPKRTTFPILSGACVDIVLSCVRTLLSVNHFRSPINDRDFMNHSWSNNSSHDGLVKVSIVPLKEAFYNHQRNCPKKF